MRVGFFSAKPYDRKFFDSANAHFHHELVYFESRLRPETIALASEYPAVCIFVNDDAHADVLRQLTAGETRLLALRCSGVNNVDLPIAEELGLTVVHVPAYSPHAVAEHAVSLILALNRKIHRAYTRVREGNLSLDGLLGFDLHGQTVGVVGTGRIGILVAQIMKGFGCNLLAYDVHPNEECRALGAQYMDLPDLLSRSDIVTLHCPLIPQTFHLIDSDAIHHMKRGVMLINTSRGGLIDTQAVVRALKSGKIGYLGIDVYEEESDIFYQDLSGRVIQDDVFARLLTLPNVIITGHQAFFTSNALQNIAETTLANVRAFEEGRESGNEVAKGQLARA